MEFLPTAVSVKELTDNSRPFVLYQNEPNPFGSETKIRFYLEQPAPVTLSVYDLTGKKVATVLNGQKQAGPHQVNFSAKDLATGVYFYRLQSGEYMSTRKLVVVKEH